MNFEFKFPDVGEGIHEGKIVKWLVKEGDEIKVDQALAEVETDKAIVEIPSPKAGKITKLFHNLGDVIKVGETIANIETTGTATTTTTPAATNDSVNVVGSLEPTAPGVMAAPSLSASGAVFGAPTKVTPAKTEPQVTQSSAPAAPVSTPKPTGLNLVNSQFKSVKKFDFFGYIDRKPYDGVRKAVGEHMVKSMFTIPHVTHTDTVDLTNLIAKREKDKAEAEKQGVHLTFMPYFIKAVIEALQKHPMLNSSLDENEGVIILKKYFNLGIAVDTEAGLMVPVLKGADKKDIFQIAKEVTDLAEKARDRKLNPMDFKGGTFTITNVGSTGSGWFFTPVINHPEAAILGIGVFKDIPVAVPATTKTGKPKVEIHKICPLSLSFDHRIIDGAEAARFTKELIDGLEAA